MKNFKKIALGLVVAAMAISFSAFTSAKRLNSNFYEYQLSSTAQIDIQNLNNYLAEPDPCGGTTTNVCGVSLSTSKPDGQKPVSSEFNAEQTNLWDSQRTHTPIGAVEMKP